MCKGFSFFSKTFAPGEIKQNKTGKLPNYWRCKPKMIAIGSTDELSCEVAISLWASFPCDLHFSEEGILNKPLNKVLSIISLEWQLKWWNKKHGRIPKTLKRKTFFFFLASPTSQASLFSMNQVKWSLEVIMQWKMQGKHEKIMSKYSGCEV